MALRHCLDCDTLTVDSVRCRPCGKARRRAESALGRRRRGPGWNTVSRRLRQAWKDAGFGCIMAYTGECKGRIQADHMGKQGPYQPLCAYHNNSKH